MARFDFWVLIPSKFEQEAQRIKTKPDLHSRVYLKLIKDSDEDFMKIGVTMAMQRRHCFFLLIHTFVDISFSLR